ncbi:transposase [Corynebacterium rouxii]|uniref:Transposase n=1 Tax=Corynebacterium rouxii TaxID=2719119 RepID=A0A6I8MG46_9CORY|nr:transposase [Corynebacterium rouxii]MDT9407948.1 transposase [Corynebacterium rouxii]MDT9410130.1 transposase [Corynebacterium rouxii]VZH84209.1 transposase [Corynebacterium rouxii]
MIVRCFLFKKEHLCSRWASTVATSKEVGVSPNSIWNWFKKGALEAEEVHEFAVTYYKEQIERLEAKVKHLEKTFSF